MNYFEYTSGLLYVIAPALADADIFGWSLVYADPQTMIFFRHPPEKHAGLGFGAGVADDRRGVRTAYRA
jgi:hypothetical protein